MDARTRKIAMRREVVARIMAMDPVDRHSQEAALADRFEALPGFAVARTVLLYATAFPEEIDTRPMLLRAFERGKHVILPKVDRPTRRLRLFEVAHLGPDLIRGVKGIPEPGPGC